MTAKHSVGSAIRRARERLGLTQLQLAESVGLPAAQTVSEIEHDSRDVKAAELARLSKVLKTPIEVLLGIIEEEPKTLVLWRASNDALGADQKLSHEAQLLERARRYAFLEEVTGTELGGEPLPAYEMEFGEGQYGWVRTIARQVANSLLLGSRPASCLPDVLDQRYGIRLFHESMGTDGSAACTKGDFGAAVLLNKDEVPWRRAFSLAHELFHLITWRQTAEWLEPPENSRCLDVSEQLANAFASELLLPEEQVRGEIDERFTRRDPGVEDLVELAYSYGVSTGAVVWRLKNLNKITAAKARELLDDPELESLNSLMNSLRGGSSGEPDVLPKRYVALARKAYGEGEISRGKLAELLEISRSELDARMAPA